MHKSLIVIDDFYSNPDTVRSAALKADYPEPEGERRYPGRNSAQQFPVKGLEPAISQIVGEPLVGASHPQASHTRFRITLADDEARYMVHVDPTPLTLVGVLYLTLPEHCQGGTAFFRHNGLDSDRTPLTEAELHAYGVPDIRTLLRQDGNDPDKWQHLMTVPMRFNRLILYRPWMWHSATPGFGDCLENGRLIQLFAFLPGTPQ